MSWSKFLVILSSLYLVYYGVVVLLDMLKGNFSKHSADSGEDIQIAGLNMSETDPSEEEESDQTQESVVKSPSIKLGQLFDEPIQAEKSPEILQSASANFSPMENAAAIMQPVESHGIDLKELSSKFKSESVFALKGINFQ